MEDVQPVVDLPRLEHLGEASARMLGCFGPELPELWEPLLRRIARDDGRRDRPYRCSRNPSRMLASFVQDLVTAGKVGTDSVTTPEHQD